MPSFFSIVLGSGGYTPGLNELFTLKPNELFLYNPWDGTISFRTPSYVSNDLCEWNPELSEIFFLHPHPGAERRIDLSDRLQSLVEHCPGQLGVLSERHRPEVTDVERGGQPAGQQSQVRQRGGHADQLGPTLRADGGRQGHGGNRGQTLQTSHPDR